MMLSVHMNNYSLSCSLTHHHYYDSIYISSSQEIEDCLTSTVIHREMKILV